MLKIKIALTGGIACGKSAVANVFIGLGAEIVDLDVIAREMVARGTEGLQELTIYFGTGILNQDATLNRRALSDKLFSNKDNKQKIESILHPKILTKMHEDIAKSNNKVAIVVVPLLIEQNIMHLFDRAIIVDCSEKNQLKRLMQRETVYEDTAKQMILAQVSRNERLNLANKMPSYVIDNNSSLQILEQKAGDLYHDIMAKINTSDF